MDKFYIIYDGRAFYDTDSASVLFTTDDLDEAIKSANEDFGDACIVEYDDNGKKLINEHVMWDCYKGDDGWVKQDYYD